MAGDETALPADSPAARLDTLGSSSLFNAVGALAISSGGFSYIGSGTTISPNWVLTAGHNLDLNDNGTPDPSLSIISSGATGHTHQRQTGIMVWSSAFRRSGEQTLACRLKSELRTVRVPGCAQLHRENAKMRDSARCFAEHGRGTGLY